MLAHVPDIGDFVAGLKVMLNDKGTVTMEFPRFLNVLEYNKFDTICHEHFSYLTLITVNRLFGDKGLKIYDVEKLSTHGGSLKIYATHCDNEMDVPENAENLIIVELDMELDLLETDTKFPKRIVDLKMDTLKKS